MALSDAGPGCSDEELGCLLRAGAGEPWEGYEGWPGGSSSGVRNT